MATAQLPSLLNYTRSIIPSEGTFWADNTPNRPLLIQDKTVLGTIANYSSVYKKDKQLDEDAINKEMMAGGNNIQRVDSCHLPADADTFELRFTLKFLANANAPEACEDSGFREALEEVAQAYAKKDGFTVLVERYLANLLKCIPARNLSTMGRGGRIRNRKPCFLCKRTDSRWPLCTAKKSVTPFVPLTIGILGPTLIVHSLLIPSPSINAGLVPCDCRIITSQTSTAC